VEGIVEVQPGQGDRRESPTDVRLDGDDMAADADDGDDGHAMGTYMGRDVGLARATPGTDPKHGRAGRFGVCRIVKPRAVRAIRKRTAVWSLSSGS